jgi:hypothetical protein
MMNRSVYLRIPGLRYQDFDAVLVHVDRDTGEQLEATFVGTAVMKRVVGDAAGAGVSTVVAAEVRDSVTWCLK